MEVEGFVVVVMERGKGEVSRTVQGFDRNVPLSRQRLSNNYGERRTGTRRSWN